MLFYACQLLHILSISKVFNVHGVCLKSLEVGRKIVVDKEIGKYSFSKGAYLPGKMVWEKAIES